MKFWLKNANSGNSDSFSRPSTPLAADSRKNIIKSKGINVSACLRLKDYGNSLVKPKPIQAFGSSKHPGRTLKVRRHALESSKQFPDKHCSKGKDLGTVQEREEKGAMQIIHVAKRKVTSITRFHERISADRESDLP